MRDSLGSGAVVAAPGRRAVLRGLTGALTLAGAGVVVGCDDAPGVGGARSGVRVERGTVSGAGFRDAKWALARPDGDAEVPVCVVLHGKGGHVDQVIGGGLRADEVLADLLAGGDSPFAVAAIDGGDTYWHSRADGSDAGALVTDHLLPLLAGDHAIATGRIGLLGWSMGGYGALLLAEQLGRTRVAGVVAESPALWFSAGETPAGAFDDAEDYAAHPVLGHQSRLRGIPVRVDCGNEDPFIAAARAYVDGFGSGVESHFGPGGHSMDYWAKQAPSQLAWLGRHLTA